MMRKNKFSFTYWDLNECNRLVISDSTEELDREENSELGINNSLQKLYRFYEHNIVEVLA